MDFQPPVFPEDPFGGRMRRHAPLWNINSHASNLLIYHELQTSRLRSSLARADWVYVPIFTEFLACWPQRAPDIAGPLVEDFYANATTFLPALGRKPHVIVLAQCEMWHAIECGIRRGLLHASFEAISSEFMFATIEVADSFRGWSQSAIHNQLNRIAIPYPSAIRYDNAKHAAHINAAPKTSLSSAPFFANLTALRRTLVQQCTERPGECRHTPFVSAAGTRQTSWEECAVDIANDMLRSWFCLQPAGDSYSRRSLYDCLVLGSIPVVFDAYWLRVFPYADLIDPRLFVVLVDEGQFTTNGTNILDYLHTQYPVPVRERMLAEVQRVQALFQWSLHPRHDMVSVDAADAVQCGDDAFTFILKSLHRKFCRMRLLPMERCPPAAQAAK